MRRIRRHVVGRGHRFFAVTAPGIEPLCRRELAALPASVKDATVRPGGVAFSGRLDACYAANLNLGTATRILMRIADFRAANFGSLEKKAGAVPWELYLQHRRGLAVEVTVRKSRLYHSAAVAERIRRAAENRLSCTLDGPSAGTRPGQRLFVRGIDDRFALSLDSSGEPLYKRGIKTHGGRAPLRETLAAALLRLIGYDGSQVLLDPLCGSGSFALEATLTALRIPPGWYRDFAFSGWPAFRPRQWRHLRRQCGAHRRPVSAARIVASDRDRTAVAALRRTVENFGWSQTIETAWRDFFSFAPADLTNPPGCVVINPPYGRRMGDDRAAARRLIRIFNKLAADYRGWRVGLVLPEALGGIRAPFRLRGVPVRHGGLRLNLATGRIG
jgi:putative N6-adenine-specific DNA methylase